MRNRSVFTFILFSLVVQTGSSQGIVSETFYVTGNRILDPCGINFIPRGINYPVLDDWNFPANMNDGGELSSQIIQANPNTVRIAWYKDYGQKARPGYSLSDLDSVITRFKRRGVVSIINLMDVTCSNDYELYNSRISWWTDPGVVALLTHHQGNVMVNIANEFGYVNWAADPEGGLISWIENYTQTIESFRTAGITVPLIIDAPDCGTSLDVLLSSGAVITGADPQGKTILSVHAYWPLEAGNDSVALRNRLVQISEAGFPVILGEIANWQTDALPCNFEINYTALLRMCEELSIPWLAWSWTNDYCELRQMSDDGNFNSLTPYGNVIVNNPQFGLAGHAMKTPYMQNDFSCLLTGIKKQSSAENAFRIVNYGDGNLSLLILKTGDVSVCDVYGRQLLNGRFDKDNLVKLDHTGMMIISHVNESGISVIRKVIR